MSDPSKIYSPMQRFQYTYRSIDEFGGTPWADSINYFVTGDINHDGQIEMILSRGDVEQIAMDLTGRVLWHFLDPSANWQHRRPDSSVFIWDLDLDGKAEFVCTRRIDGQEHLCLIDAMTGDSRTATPLTKPTGECDNRGFVRLGLLDGPDQPGYVIAGWDYGRLAVYDCSLRLLWELDAPIGHDPFCYDLDGDGHEEIICGYLAFDREGHLLWDSRHYLEHDSHADSFVFFQEQGEVRLFTSEGHILDASGQLVDAIGQDILIHGQEAGIISTDQELRFVIQDRCDGVKQTTYAFTRQGAVTFEPSGAQNMQPVIWDGQGAGGIWLDTHGLIYDADGEALAKVRAFEKGSWRTPTRGVGSAHDLMYDGRDELIIRHFDEDNRSAWCEIYALDKLADRNEHKTTTRPMADWSFY